MNTTKAYYDQFSIESTLNLESVDPIFITDLLSKTNIAKAAGIDKISGTFIKVGASCFWEHFTKILNLSIQSSVFPDSCKIAKLIALFKKGSRTEPKNYRPISENFHKNLNFAIESKITSRDFSDEIIRFIGLNK